MSKAVQRSMNGVMKLAIKPSCRLNSALWLDQEIGTSATFSGHSEKQAGGQLPMSMFVRTVSMTKLRKKRPPNARTLEDESMDTQLNEAIALAMGNGWSQYPGDEVTCPRCVKKLAAKSAA